MEEKQKSNYVHQVFENISRNYDVANNRISLGFQKKWKRNIIVELKKKLPRGAKVLDLCCGTGDLAICLRQEREDLEIMGVDFSSAMLEKAKEKSEALPITWIERNALSLPFGDNIFSAVCISFGLRNVGNYRKALIEIKRVLKRDAWVYCLDSFVPDNFWIRPWYQIYFKYIMPYLGGGKKYYQEYCWLYESTQEFLREQECIELFQEIGFQKIVSRHWMFGTCVLIQGKK